MKKINTLGLLLALLLSMPQAQADLNRFEPDSMAAIETRHQGQPFVLALWSLECPPCYKELAMLADWQRQNPARKLVLISTDSDASAAELASTLARFDFSQAEQWVFADSDSRRLRYAIDTQWRGELPRSYVYGANRSRRAVSGILATEDLPGQ